MKSSHSTRVRSWHQGLCRRSAARRAGQDLDEIVPREHRAISDLKTCLLGTDIRTPLPELPAAALRVDLDPGPEADTDPGERVPGHPGVSPWS
jgi:hypothetical protein